MEALLNVTVLIILAAILLDLLIGDPKWLPHPVVGYGKGISFLDKKLNHGSGRRRKIYGILMAVMVVTVVYSLSFSLIYLAFRIHLLAGLILEVYFISTTIAIRGLREAALKVAIPLAKGDFTEARFQLGMIVGRDTDKLSESEIVRGTVETVAENTVDGITAPLFWAFIGGGPLAMAYRAINTLDSMVGYKNEKYSDFGWFSARLDDVANWLPARMTSFTIWLASFCVLGSRKKHAIHVTWKDATKHPSPNSGWSEAMVAGLIGVQLGGRNEYKGVVSNRAKMGVPLETLTCDHINKSLIYMHGGWILFFIFFSLIWISLS
ncbi:cobalamin biosynthesis protein CobD [Salipaludibacillus keqinensis]|uniref:Cobalamin biosynthesis protein CobD n=1 Tax=Salipaludibacillus keqinensis TaxID=2045207 RepID=A0A323TA77_9BACI|nr:adenosylcobinamide-phosphate synthase CbiB [Salipaludibacillus keqinensis]PYZ92311.1 cobalamin biosynthesis protein CobD [Salipaludibacillus keqinensis]